MKKKMPFHRRFILPYRDFVDKVNTFDGSGLSDSALKEELRNSSHCPRRYGLIKETIIRCKGMVLFDTQLSAAYAMEQGMIAELPTGEGKTLAAVVTALSLALSGEQVQILVFNDYLAARDYKENKEVFQFCGLSCGCILQTTKREHRQAAYDCNILYITAREAGFDYLRNFMAFRESGLLRQHFHTAIVDEADSILIDEAGIPLVLAGEEPTIDKNYMTVWKTVKELDAQDIEFQEKEHQVWLTERGAVHAERLLGVNNLYELENAHYLEMIHTFLEARLLYKKDRDYIVKNGTVFVIEHTTGRVAEGRRFPDHLHLAIEIKEGVKARKGSQIYNMMPLQFYLLKYRRLCGMTGTAWSSRKELKNMYDLSVIRIPPHVPCIRRDHEDVILSTNQALYTQVYHKIRQIHQTGQPILIGTQSVEESEALAGALRKRNLPCFVLNAKEDEKEAELIALAGRPYRITISTNMAGRGVDIKLDKDAVTAGGLFVLSTGINRSFRIDQQLRGRTGRQGEPGESQFFISMEQPLIKRHVIENTGKVQIRRIQRMAEGEDAQMRYLLEKYSLILEKHRRMITQYREVVLRDIKSVHFFETNAPVLYKKRVAESGTQGVLCAEQQLLLFYINQHWVDYLAAMESARESIHFAILGGEEPVDVYQRFAVRAFAEMEEDIKKDVLSKLKTCKITEHGVDLRGEGLIKATNTWTYMIDESKSQFAKVPSLLKYIRKLKGTQL